ncbi:MAG: hypothetical protein KH897_16780 [Bacteroides sp.]|uniref:hypothetical protein n=1 Tax=Bacteroides sp. TaxID=29523 RepID=UPI0025C44026|nr:hypothetical protein [Bacteroides sp.]MBS6239975.1 hypothetical protein [Bacteroides sp.]
MNNLRFTLYLVLIFLVACRQESSLERALAASGENRKELELVLDYFRGDSLKYKAACFLIENMPGAFAVDEEIVAACQPFYQMYDSLSHTYDYDSLSIYDQYPKGKDWGRQIDSLWNAYSSYNNEKLKKDMCIDIKTIKASRLITEIEQAFRVWKENVYTRNYSFESFCDYILPYRQENGLLVDSARQVFYSRHHGQFFVNSGKNMIEEADSLLRLYSYIGHSGFHATGIPIWDVTTLEKLRHGLCTHKCWHNTLLFSSLGIAVATDIVPAWANRGSSHSWSVLIEEGDIHPFNPFWEQDLWQYKRLYNNMDYHKYWGRFRLPKVFRKTYRYYMEGPLADGVPAKDIPEAFRSLRKKDVSHEYFDTVNVRIKLRKVPSGTKYAYLCVWNYNNWKPVHWGKITEDVALFSGMGKDIVYLPMYCMDGEMVVAADPVLVQKDGKVRILHPEDTREEMVTTQYTGVLAYPLNRYNNGIIAGTVLKGGKVYGRWGDTLCVFPERIELNSQRLQVQSKDSVRYVRMMLPTKGMALGDLKFYKETFSGKELVKSVRWMTSLPLSFKGEPADNIFDAWSSTGYRRPLDTDYVDLDLGECCLLSEVSFCPYLDVEYKEDEVYELCIWQNGWQVVTSGKGGKPLHFTDVPKNALWLIRPSSQKERKHVRPFVYENGEVYWH